MSRSIGDLNAHRIGVSHAPDVKEFKSGGVSRSIGDLNAHRIGVLHTPDVKEFKVDASARMILLASDGVWDMLDNEEAGLA
ncbi:hypothetical protein T484DRAFT_1869007 [Baffinella frigidus]|nr:hypothetical protein T484DRAFT_1869007 [Cryptophyta sp. CCMP2293]